MTIRVSRVFLVALAVVVAAAIGAAIALLASDDGDSSGGDNATVTAATQAEDRDSNAVQIRHLCEELLQSTKIVRYSRSSGTTPVDELRELAARLNAAAAAAKAVRISEGAELVQSLEGASESAREAARNGGDSAPLLGALAAMESVSVSLGLGDACTIHVIPTP